jgi:hypothetical protein
MPRHVNYVPHGVIPAVLLPFDPDLAIDEASFRKHLRDVASVEGLSAYSATIWMGSRIAAFKDVPDIPLVASSILLPSQESEGGRSHNWSALRARCCRARSSTERLQSQHTGDRAWSRPPAAEGGGASRQP